MHHIILSYADSVASTTWCLPHPPPLRTAATRTHFAEFSCCGELSLAYLVPGMFFFIYGVHTCIFSLREQAHALTKNVLPGIYEPELGSSIS